MVAESAYPLDAASEKEVATKLEKRLGKTIKLETRTNPELINGIRFIMGDQIMDDSVAKRLEILSDRFITK